MAFGLTFSHEALAKAKKRLVGGNSANSKLVLLQYLGRVHGWVGDETTNATIVPRFLLVNTVVSMESQCRFTAGELDRTKHTTHSDFSGGELILSAVKKNYPLIEVPGRTRTRDPARGETGGWLALWIAVDR